MTWPAGQSDTAEQEYKILEIGIQDTGNRNTRYWKLGYKILEIGIQEIEFDTFI